MADAWADRKLASRELKKIHWGLGEGAGAVKLPTRRGGGGRLVRVQRGATDSIEPGGKYEAMVEQVGDAVGQKPYLSNWVTKIDLDALGFDGAGSAFFCNQPVKGAKKAQTLGLLSDTDHPRIDFRFPVKNVHVELTDLGRAGDAKAKPRVLWDAEFGQSSGFRRLQEVAHDLPSEGGDMPRMRRLCPPASTPWRVEFHITAEDPRLTDENTEVEDPDRGIDETIQYEIRLLPEGSSRLRRKWFHKTAPMQTRQAQPYMLPNIREGPCIESGVPYEASLLQWPGAPRRESCRRRRGFVGQAFL